MTDQSERIVCLVQARMGSSRLPEKVMKEICGQPMLSWVIDRARRSTLITTFAVATTTSSDDQDIADWCSTHHVACYRGAEYDVLDRFYRAASWLQADIVVRLTGDCPFMDASLIDQAIVRLQQNKLDFVANRLPPPFHRSFPIGLDVEVVRFPALQQAWQQADQPFEREHVMPYIYEEPGRFVIEVLHADQDQGAQRWTVDTPQDLDFIQAVAQEFGCRNDFSWKEVLCVLDAKPELMRINAAVQHKSFRDVDNRSAAEKDQTQ